MTDKPTEKELRVRIERDKAYFDGKIPDRHAVAWSGYIAALMEWGLIQPSEHRSLVKLLMVKDSPAADILQGR